MTKRLAAVAGALAMTAVFSSNPAAAADFPDLRGVWTANYLAVAPSNAEHPGPRFNEAEWRVEIKQQKDNVFWGTSRWRLKGQENWNEVETTGSINLKDPNIISIVEKSPNRRGAKGVVDGTLADGKIYVNFKGVEFGVSFSTVLEKSSGN